MFGITIEDLNSRLNSIAISDATQPSKSAVEDVIAEYEAVVMARVRSRGIADIPVGSEAYNICRLVVLRLVIAEVQNLAAGNATSLSTELYTNTMSMLDDITKRPSNLGEPVTDVKERVGVFESFGKVPPLNPRIARFL